MPPIPPCRHILAPGYARECNSESKWSECPTFQIARITTNPLLRYLGQYVLDAPRSE